MPHVLTTDDLDNRDAERAVPPLVPTAVGARRLSDVFPSRSKESES